MPTTPTPAPPTTLDLWSQIVPLSAACVSGVASTFLLWRLRKLAATRQRRLLVRQLTHLAAGNLLYSIPEALLLLVGIILWDHPAAASNSAKTGMCICMIGIENVGGYVMLLVECQMAVAFVTSISGSSRTMHVMYTLLVYIWPVCLLLSALDTWLVQVVWKDSEGGCYGKQDWMFGIFSATGFLVCLGCYVVSSVVVGRAGRQVQRAVWSRARQYPAVAIVTLGPITIYYFIRPFLLHQSEDSSLDWQELVYLVANFLYDATGFLNFLVYALQSKYMGNRIGMGAHGAAREGSFRVNFCANDSVVEAETPPDTPGWSEATATDSLLIEYYDGLSGDSGEIS